MREYPSDSPVNVLLIEDDPAHAVLLRRALQDSDDPHLAVEHIQDGESALAYLAHYVDGRREHNTNLSLVLLDLRLPKVDGLNVLREIKANVALADVPVVILSTSEAERDIKSAYDAKANGYVVKPDEYGALSELTQDLCRFWLRWNRTRPVGISQ